MKYSNPDMVLREAAGPAPWYIRAFPPKLDGVEWQETPESSEIGAMVLTRVDDGGIVALIGMYCCVLAIDRDRFLVWYQAHSAKKPKDRDRIHFIVASASRLQTLSDAKAFGVMKEDDMHLMFEDETAVTFDLPADLRPGSHLIQFPEALKFKDELLLWGHCTSPNFQSEFGKNNDLCLFILRPRSNTVEIVPQDWFNNSDTLDFGYQWVTRVARDPGSKRIYGEGIRLAPFVLDDSLKNVEEWFGAWSS